MATTAVSAYAEASALGQLSSSEATVIYSTEPLWGVAFACMMLGETVGCCVLRAACCLLHAACCLLRAACCVLCAACCLLFATFARIVLEEKANRLLSPHPLLASLPLPLRPPLTSHLLTCHLSSLTSHLHFFAHATSPLTSRPLAARRLSPPQPSEAHVSS